MSSKFWPRHERRSTLSRMLKEEGDYILPVRFDDTSVPGMSDTLFYLKAHENSPAELSAKIANRIGKPVFDGKASDVPPPRMTSPLGEAKFDYSSYNGRYVIGSGVAEFETRWSKASDTSIHIYNDPHFNSRSGNRPQRICDSRNNESIFSRLYFTRANSNYRSSCGCYATGMGFMPPSRFSISRTTLEATIAMNYISVMRFKERYGQLQII